MEGLGISGFCGDSLSTPRRRRIALSTQAVLRVGLRAPPGHGGLVSVARQGWVAEACAVQVRHVAFAQGLAATSMHVACFSRWPSTHMRFVVAHVRPFRLALCDIACVCSSCKFKASAEQDNFRNCCVARSICERSAFAGLAWPKASLHSCPAPWRLC